MGLHKRSIIVASDEWQFNSLIFGFFAGNTTYRFELFSGLISLGIESPISILLIFFLLHRLQLAIAIKNSLILISIRIINGVFGLEIIDYIFPWIVVGTFCQSH